MSLVVRKARTGVAKYHDTAVSNNYLRALSPLRNSLSLSPLCEKAASQIPRQQALGGLLLVASKPTTQRSLVP